MLCSLRAFCCQKQVPNTDSHCFRFREFLTLHAALEEDSRLRTAMKGVKGPNKWLNLPFSKLDSTTIATRKQFLEKYLQVMYHSYDDNTLCNSFVKKWGVR